ncbi:electron transfer flavoprotein subunit alpha/FixB family protein [Chloroflexota bacterium]
MVESLYSIEEENQSLWVFLEHTDGKLEEVSLELLTQGRVLADQMDWQLAGIIGGHKVNDLAKVAIHFGADQVLLADHPDLENFVIEPFCHIVEGAIMEAKPSVFLSGATINGRDLAGRLAVRLRTGLNADCTNLRMNPENGVLISEVTGFGGGVIALIEMQTHRPQMATVRPGVFQIGTPDKKRKGKITKLKVDIPEDLVITEILERVIGEGVNLSQAETLVVGGRGVNGDYALMGELAELLGGVVGATRPPVDEGHIERERMVGQTGTVCRPKLAVICGVSGAFHFVVGIQDAEMVIAINSDPEAPIFEHADYCIVGDVFEIVPALVEKLRQPAEVQHA